MPATLRPTRLEVSDRFPMLGFNIRSDGTATRGELALTTDALLYRPENKGRRTPSNFYCSRAAGNLVLGRGETMYIVPPDVLARFVGQEKLFFGLATAGEGTVLHVDVLPNPESPYVSLRGLTQRSMTRVRVLPTRQQRAAGYQGDGPSALDWAGDSGVPGMAPVASPAAPGAGGDASLAPAGASPYDDGFGPLPTAPSTPSAPAAAAAGLARGGAPSVWGQAAYGEIQQAGSRGATALEAGPSFEVKYRMFIPSPLIDAPIAVYGGDGRSFSYSGGTSRGEITARVRLTPGGGIAGVDLLSRHWGESTQYNGSDSHPVPGKPGWWLAPNEGAHPTARATLAASDSNLRAYAGAPGTTRSIQAVAERASLVTIEASGALPLSSLAPSIDADVSLLVRIGSGGLEVKVQGEHDGFPCHELYVNGQLIYQYDPVAAGSSPTALAPPMDVTASTPWRTVPLAASHGLAATPAAAEPARLMPPPEPRARAMEGGASAAIAIGGFIVSSIRDSQGDVTWELDQFAHIKHPNDAAPASPAAFRNASTIRLNRWPVAGGLVDDISAWFAIDWQFNGQSLGNVSISNIGTNDAVGWGLHVRAQIMDDNILYAPNQCAALRIRLHYRFNRSIGSDVIAVTDVHLFGDGTYQASYNWVQADTLSLEAMRPQAAASEPVNLLPPPEPRARAMDGGVSAAIAIGGFLLESVRDSEGDVTWELDQFAHIKHPNDTAPANPPAFRDATPIRLNRWPVAGGLVDDISAWFSIEWQFNGRSLGNIRISNIGTNDAVGWGLHVRAQIMDDNILYAPNQCAALRVRLHYRFSRGIGSDVIAATDVHLFGDGTYQASYNWIQASTLSLEAAPSLTGSQGGISWDLAQYPALYGAGAQAAGGQRIDASPISLADWPYIEDSNGERTQAELTVHWAHDAAGGVGGVRIVPGAMRSGPGSTLAVTATVSELPAAGGPAGLVVTLRYAFRHPTEGDQLAITTLTLSGNGTCARHSEWQAGSQRIAA